MAEQKSFHLMSCRSVRYIRMRHYSVLAFAGMRMGNVWYLVKYGTLAFVSAPMHCLKLIFHRSKTMIG